MNPAIRRLMRGQTEFDFVGLRKRWLIISSVMVGVSLLALAVLQLNLGLEFRGGVAVAAENPSGATVAELREAIRAAGVADPRIQLVDDGAAVRIQTGALGQDAEDAMVDAISAVTGTNRVDASIDAVGPTFGALVARQAVIALLVFLAAAAVFITIRLQWKMAMAGLVALAHDLIITVGIYALTGFEVTPATVVAILTILGYSLYDTVVVFDKVREFEGDLADVLPYEDIVNRSMNQVLMRSLATSLTSLLPVGSLLFVGSILLGAASLQEFALALFVGIGVGTYSSIFVAGPLLAKWKGGEPEWVEHKERLEKRAAAKEARLSPPSPSPAPKASPGTGTPAAPTGVVARPPKKKRRRR